MRMRSVAALTEAAGTLPMFSDDFSTGDFSYSANGVSWGATNVGAGDGSVAVVSGIGYGGANGIRFRYNAGPTGEDRHVEKRMAFTPGFDSQFWMRYYYFCPANRNHPVSSPVSNDKFWIAIWGGDYNVPSTPGFDINCEPRVSGQSEAGVFFFNANWAEYSYPSFYNAINTAHFGTWRRMVFGYILPQNSSQYGRVGVWQDQGVTGTYTKVIDTTSAQVNSGRSNYVTGQSYLDQAYLMGWRNSDCTNTEDHIISHVDIHDSNAPFGVSW